MRPRAIKENLFAHGIHRSFFWMRLFRRDGHALGLGRKPGYQCFQLGAKIASQRVRLCCDHLAIPALQRLHAVKQSRLNIHHAVGIGEITRELGIGTSGDASTQAKITRFQCRSAGTLRLDPELLSLLDHEDGRIIVAHQIPVLIKNALISQCGDNHQQQPPPRYHHHKAIQSHRIIGLSSHPRPCLPGCRSTPPAQHHPLDRLESARLKKDWPTQRLPNAPA